MAVDQALLEESDATGAAFLRLYRWNPPCLSFGRNEPALTRYDRAAIARRGIAVVRRPTGGRAVWHEHEVTYAVAAPIAAFGSLTESYRDIHARLARALCALGLDARLAPAARMPSLGAGACFAASAGGEVLVSGRKVVGSAQVRRGAAFLQHGSILLDGSQDVVRAVSHQRSDVSGETTLSAELGRPVGFDEVAQAIVHAWDEPFDAVAPCRPLPPAAAQCSDPAWIWRR
jgi:lipoyl(octanoyl) transferase